MGKPGHTNSTNKWKGLSKGVNAEKSERLSRCPVKDDDVLLCKVTELGARAVVEFGLMGEFVYQFDEAGRGWWFLGTYQLRGRT